jgi:hypothetical protein
LASVSGQAALFCHAQALSKAAPAAPAERRGLIDRSVVIDAVAGADHDGGSGNGTPGDADARLKSAPVRADERAGIVDAGDGPDRIAAEHRSAGGESGS